MTKPRNWDYLNKQARKRARNSVPVTSIPVETDAAFWRAWRDDPKAMRDSGYRVRKTAAGWQAFILQGGNDGQ
jgi:hypothetical protein